MIYVPKNIQKISIAVKVFTCIIIDILF